MSNDAIKVYDTPEQNLSGKVLPWIIGLIIMALIVWGIANYV